MSHFSADASMSIVSSNDVNATRRVVGYEHIPPRRSVSLPQTDGIVVAVGQESAVARDPWQVAIDVAL